MRSIELTHSLYQLDDKTLVGYLLTLEYQASAMRTFDEVIFEKLSVNSIKDLLREIIEINLNLTSMGIDLEKVSK